MAIAHGLSAFPSKSCVSCARKQGLAEESPKGHSLEQALDPIRTVMVEIHGCNQWRGAYLLMLAVVLVQRSELCVITVGCQQLH